jgi:hypothetical protein
MLHGSNPILGFWVVLDEEAEQVDEACPHFPRFLIGKVFAEIFFVYPFQFIDVVLLEWHVSTLRHN